MKKIVVLVLLNLCSPFLWAQSHSDFDSLGFSVFTDFSYDSTIVTSYEHLFGLETYIQQKQLSLNYRGDNKSVFKFQPNSSMALGLGFTYRYLALSAAFNVLPLKENKVVNTKTFDFQSQIASYRFLSFITAQFYKGFSSEHRVGGVTNPTIPRPDMGMSLLGLNNMFSLNKKYSFRGSVLRFQRMRYSVGAPLVVLEGNYFLQSGALPLVSTPYQSLHDLDLVRRLRIWNFGFGGGYSYTWVINKRLLFAGIATLKVPLNFYEEHKVDQSSLSKIKTGLNGNLWLRGSYERDDWSISLHYIQNRILMGESPFDFSFSGNYGMARLIFSKRFGINRKLKKGLRPLDAVLDIPYRVIGKK